MAVKQNESTGITDVKKRSRKTSNNSAGKSKSRSSTGKKKTVRNGTKAAAKYEGEKAAKGSSGNIQSEIVAIILLMLAVFTYLSISKFQDVPGDTQFIGLIGTYFIKGIEAVFGEAGLLVPAFLLLWSIQTAVYKKIWSGRMWGITLACLGILVSVSLQRAPVGVTVWEASFKGIGGGYIGGALSFVLIKLVGRIGAIVILIFGMLMSLLLIVEKPFSEIIKYVVRLIKFAGQKLDKVMFQEVPEEQERETANQPVRRTTPLIVDLNDTEQAVQEELVPKRELVLEHQDNLSLNKNEKEIGETETDHGFVNGKVIADGEYFLPGIELLSDISSERTIDKKNIKDSIAVLEDTFTSFGISVKVNQVSCGPAVTRYELTPGTGVKISKIIGLTDDLQLNLAAPGIRIEAPIPGKSAVGIEVPNRKILSVGLRRMLSSSAFSRLNSPLAFALGEDISGNSVAARLNDMPHLLIAGSTGSGKSVCLNCIIMSFLYNAYPDELKMVFIDPKMVELTVYNGIPHLMTPVVTDPKKASVILKWMVTEMEKRYQKFADAGVRDIQRYNQECEEKLPYIVIIIDELADLMMIAPVEVEDSICRLAQMARAAGMHLIVATQRPSVDVVTGIIKANIPSRIAFAVSSQADSRTILDTSGAEKLLGKGDMLFFPVGAVKPFRIQGAYVSDDDIENTVKFIKEQAVPVEENEEIKDLEVSMQKAEQEDYGDDLYWDAVTVFVDSKKASVSLLQRRLRIGYARAARLVDMMEDRGIVSEIDSNKRREVLINREQLEMLIERHNSL